MSRQLFTNHILHKIPISRFSSKRQPARENHCDMKRIWIFNQGDRIHPLNHISGRFIFRQPQEVFVIQGILAIREEENMFQYVQREWGNELGRVNIFTRLCHAHTAIIDVINP